MGLSLLSFSTSFETATIQHGSHMIRFVSEIIPGKFDRRLKFTNWPSQCQMQFVENAKPYSAKTPGQASRPGTNTMNTPQGVARFKNNFDFYHNLLKKGNL